MPIKGTYYNATLGAAPTSVASGVSAPYLGTVISGSITGASFNQGTSPTSINIITTGTYLFTFSIPVNNVVTAGTGSFVGTNQPSGVQTIFPATNLGQATFLIVGSVVIKQASGVYGINISTTPANTLLGGGDNYGFFQAVRIG